MRRFDAAYLQDTRRGMWADDRSPLAPLALGDQASVLDVGSGTGAFTTVLREEAPDATVVALDADADLLAAGTGPRVRGDATRLPFPDDAVDLVVCQALLVNLPDPVGAVREFARVAADRVAVVEPDNAAVSVASTVDSEPALARRAREAYVAGVPTDVTLGADAADVLREAGLSAVQTATYHHARTVDPPYADRDVEAARRKATGTRLDETRATLLAGGLTPDEYEALRADWRSMGRTVAAQMGEGRYRRAEVVPFHVAAGAV